MFLEFLYLLRAQGLPVSTHEWLSLLQALEAGLDGGRPESFYHLGKALLVKSEGHFDAYDVAFARFFQGMDLPLEVKEALARFLDKPAEVQSETLPQILDHEALLEAFRKLLEEQKTRHDGGNRAIGTRGASPFGNMGQNPSGKRVGGQSGARSAVYLAESRQFRNYRSDVTLNVRQFKVALKGLRRLERAGPEVLQLPETIDRSAKQGGDIELVFGPDRKNTVKLLLLMDAGGSMDPYAGLVSRLFSAAFEARHFKRFEYYYFHNCIYARIYKDIERREGLLTEKMFRELTPDFRVVLVGDAAMASWELNGENWVAGFRSPQRSGWHWFNRIRNYFKDAVWLNPEPKVTWDHPTVSQIGALFPMFELSLDGLNRAIRRLRAGRRDLR